MKFLHSLFTSYDPVASTALDQAVALGLATDRAGAYDVLLDFYDRAALVTHPHGSLRYGGYVLDIDGDDILGVYRFDDAEVCPECHGSGKLTQYDLYAGKKVRVPCYQCHKA